MRLNKLMKLIIWIVFFESIGFLMGLVTQANRDPWYKYLNKSSLTPPGFIFSIAWLLTPYLFWLLFASYLNSFIALMN